MVMVMVMVIVMAMMMVIVSDGDGDGDGDGDADGDCECDDDDNDDDDGDDVFGPFSRTVKVSHRRVFKNALASAGLVIFPSLILSMIFCSFCSKPGPEAPQK